MVMLLKCCPSRSSRPQQAHFFCSSYRPGQRGTLITELVVAMGILTVGLLPLSMGYLQDTKLSRASYRRAIVMEIIDGEMEALVAGEWKSFAIGTHPYPVRAESATNLPPGQFKLTRTDKVVRLEWLPAGRGGGSPTVREATLPSTTSAESEDKK